MTLFSEITAAEPITPGPVERDYELAMAEEDGYMEALAAIIVTIDTKIAQMQRVGSLEIAINPLRWLRSQLQLQLAEDFK